MKDLFVLNERATLIGEWPHGFFSYCAVGARVWKNIAFNENCWIFNFFLIFTKIFTHFQVTFLFVIPFLEYSEKKLYIVFFNLVGATNVGSIIFHYDPDLITNKPGVPFYGTYEEKDFTKLDPRIPEGLPLHKGMLKIF